MLILPNIYNSKVIEQMKKGTFEVDGVSLGATYEDVSLLWGSPFKSNILKPTEHYFCHNYGVDSLSVLAVFCGKPEWEKRRYKLYSIDYNYKDELFTEKKMIKSWGEPKKKKHNSSTGITVYHYGYTKFHFNKQQLFGISYLNKKLEKKKWFKFV